VRIPLAALLGIVAVTTVTVLTFAQPRSDLFPFYDANTGLCAVKVAECELAKYEKPWYLPRYYVKYKCTISTPVIWEMWKVLGRVRQIVGYYYYIPDADLPDIFLPVHNTTMFPVSSVEELRGEVAAFTYKLYKHVDVLEVGICR